MKMMKFMMFCLPFDIVYAVAANIAVVWLSCNV